MTGLQVNLLNVIKSTGSLNNNRLNYHKKLKKSKKSNLQLLIINQDSGYLMIDIANAFADKGICVTLLTGRLVIRNNNLKDGVIVKKIIKYNRKTNLSRILTWSLAFIQILLLVKLKYRSFTLLIVSNPPFTAFLPLFVKNKFSMLIFDIFPDAISEMGILSSDSFIIKTWEKANKKAFSKAENIYTLTNGMKDVVQKYSGSRKVQVMQLWSDNRFLRPFAAAQNPFIINNKLGGKFIVMYSGNIGKTQNLQVIIEIAEQCAIRSDILFMIIGDGIMRKQISKQIRMLKLPNCILMPWQEPKNIPFSFAASNLALISIGKLSSPLAIPSKLYNFVSAGSPILALAPRNSELHTLIDKLNLGRCFDISEKEQICSYICWLADNPEICQNLQENALRASQQFTVDNANKLVTSMIC